MRSQRIINLAIILTLLVVWLGTRPVPIAAQTNYDCATATGLPQYECEALVAFYEATDGDSWAENTNWLATTTPCDWFGVTCSAGQVIYLYMYNNQLSGSIPPELGNITALEILELNINQLSGSIPSELGNLSALKILELNINQLNGSIPSELGNLTALKSLNLSNNQLSGSIPPELGNLSALEFLDLAFNQLSGSIPPGLGNLTALWKLSLSSNQLSGSIPSELGNLSALTSLSLSSNQLSGSTPPELGSISALTELRLDNNQLSGPIPDSMTSLTALESFSFYLTGLCLPSTSPVMAWLDGIESVSGTTYICEQQPGSLGGIVRSSDSIPLASIQVNLYRRISPVEIRYLTETHTDASGSYRFYNLQENTNYIVRFLDPALIYAAEYYNDIPTAAQAAPLTVTKGECRTDIDAFLEIHNMDFPFDIHLPLIFSPAPSPVTWTLTPFDANTEDLIGPSAWGAMYGKIPEIIVSSDGVALDVLAQDYDPATPWNAVLLHIEPGTSGYMVTQALTDIPMLDRVMGLAADDTGNRYYATAVDEGDVVSPEYPPLDTYRSDIVRVIKLNPAGELLFNIDLDIARHASDGDAEMIISPTGGRLTIGGDEIALVHGIATAPDPNLDGGRHQKALSTRLYANSGFIRRTSSVWVSHSFDQRLFYDGDSIIEHHLGDAYPREIVFGRDHVSYPLFYIKGELGHNNTATRLGNISLIENDPQYRYIALFVTENSVTPPTYDNLITGPRNLAIVRVKDSDNSIDPDLPDVLTVTSNDEQQTNRLRWLTHYSEASNLHAERPKLIGLGNDRYIVLWEQWLHTGGGSDSFNGVYAMVIDDEGNTIQPARLITDQHHLHRGDDAFLLDKRAAWMTGNQDTKTLHIHFVDAALNYEMVTVK